MRILDLFCNAGGATRGYQMAFPDAHVTGIDIELQPNYVGDTFMQADAIACLRNRPFIESFDLVHASPVCHDWSALASISGKDGSSELLTLTLDLLRTMDVPWVVENVVGAPLPKQADLFGRHGVVLCGTMFGLKVIRHRLFECSFPLAGPGCGSHEGEFYAPAGHGDPNWKRREANPHLHGPGYADRCRTAMGIDWMTRDELAQAIPPAYCQFIGEQFASQFAAGVV